ncbi:MAG TPA: hypothetical protein VMU47_13685 [Caldimonas sp.]|nr:hypothetical protein [Caldimonas sp.]
MGSRISRSMALAATLSVLSAAAAASVAPTGADARTDPSRFAARVWHELTDAQVAVTARAPDGSPRAQAPGASGTRNVVAEPPPRTLPEPSSVAFVAGAFGVLALITRRRKR